MRISVYNDTKFHMIIGDPIIHSFSPIIYNRLYSRYGMNIASMTTHVKKGEIQRFLDARDLLRLHVFNATIPHKVDLIPFIDVLDPIAREYASVNTVLIKNDRLYGHTTDAQGFSLSLKERDISLAKQDVVILGAGGAASTIAMQAAMEGAASIVLLARNIESSRLLAQKVVNTTFLNCTADLLENAVKYTENATMVVNATPLGMSSCLENFESFDFIDALPKRAVVFDTIYSPRNTKLLMRAKHRGLQIIGGLNMLIWQAFASFEKMYDFLPGKDELDSVYAAMREEGIDV